MKIKSTKPTKLEAAIIDQIIELWQDKKLDSIEDALLVALKCGIIYSNQNFCGNKIPQATPTRNRGF